MSQYLYKLVNRVPAITDEQIAEMRHIEPVFRVVGNIYRKIADVDKLHPRDVSCIAMAIPVGEELAPGILDQSEIITMHRSGSCFVPSLAEVYAWIRVYFGDNWRQIKYFCLGEYGRFCHSTDCWCRCQVMGDLTAI